MNIDELVSLVKAHDPAIFQYADKIGIDPLCLRSKMLLHTPRFPNPTVFDVFREMYRLGEECQKPPREWLEAPQEPVELGNLEFGPLDADTAKIYHEALHYVGSYRPGCHYALRDNGRIVCMGSLAEFDLKHNIDFTGIPPHKVLVFSRFFAYRWAPDNIFSFFWGKLRQELIKEFDIKLMFSFINPNLGFSGNSHKGAQFRTFAYEEGTQYKYDDTGNYRTMRYCLQHPDSKFQQQTMELKPMMILANSFHKETAKLIPSVPYNFRRPVL